MSKLTLTIGAATMIWAGFEDHVPSAVSGGLVLIWMAAAIYMGERH